VQDITKVACSYHNLGISNGICDGFGKTQCAPPFIGDDCSIKDCKANCSFNGWCSIEYPVSRCMCAPGYYGDICDKKICLNNCTYPNGLCNSTDGQCQCRMMFSPYLNTREFKPWDGEDCSYLFPYAAGELSSLAGFKSIFSIFSYAPLSSLTSFTGGVSGGVVVFWSSIACALWAIG
jgi:hypothetical protein